jgi:hypothetical protein
LSDSKWLEIDPIVEERENVRPIEIKSGHTIVPVFFHNLQKWADISGNPNRPAMIVYSGERKLAKGKVRFIRNKVAKHLRRKVSGFPPSRE